MDPSETNINLYPEKRQRQASNLAPETSPFFEPSRSNGKQDSNNHGTSGANSSTSVPPKLKPLQGRQTVLNFSNGHLSTKLPLTNPTPRTDASRMTLTDVAKETIHLLPGLLATRPDVGTDGHLLQPTDLSPLPANLHPNLPPTKIRVIDADTLDAALSLQPAHVTSSSTSTYPVCVLNMANAKAAGGGFRHGALAQEEALCYRTSLSFTLKYRFYPLPEESAVFSPRVLIIRDSISNGHDLLDLTVPANLPVVSVVSCAAVCLPKLTRTATGGSIYARRGEKELMIKKMRVILRVCVKMGCRKVVLGAFGCGAFANPAQEVAEMWKEVLEEAEFQGCWEDMVFAVLDGRRDDNFEIFKMVLHGLQV